MGVDGRWEGELKLSHFDRAVEVREVNKFIVNGTTVGFGGTVGQPKIYSSIDGSEDSGDEGRIVSRLGFVGNEICRNLWLPRVKAHVK